MIGLALSGGGSRAIAFHLGCLRALSDTGVLDQVGVLSTISGGSVIGAYYAYTPELSFDEFEKRVRAILRSGFQRRIVLELLKPWNLVPWLAGSLLGWLVRLITREGEGGFLRYPTTTDMLRRVLQRSLFGELSLHSDRRRGMEIVVGACELRTGTAFRFGSQRSGDWRHGEVVSPSIPVALAVAASAAYPLFLPALNMSWRFRRNGEESVCRVILTDGGVYDNLGIQVLEPGRDPSVSLHAFPCDYLIVCHAGHGQESGNALPTRFLARIRSSFDVNHRRVQDSAMHRLHQLKETGLLKGFALPYLGQQDDRLPWAPSCLVPREDVVDYPTDFAAMSEAWIDKLSNRGEQLTRILVSVYLADLLS